MVDASTDFTSREISQAVSESLSGLRPKDLEPLFFSSADPKSSNEVLNLIGTLARIHNLKLGIIIALQKTCGDDGEPLATPKLQALWSTLEALSFAATARPGDTAAEALSSSFSAHILGIVQSYHKATNPEDGVMRQNAADDLLAALRGAGLEEVTVTGAQK